MLKAKYVGSKASRTWRFDGQTTIIWSRPGDIQEVPERHQKVVRAHPDIWEIVGHSRRPDPAVMPEEIAPEETKAEPPLIDLSHLDKDQLQAYCQRELGEQMDRRWSEQRMRDHIITLVSKRG